MIDIPELKWKNLTVLLEDPSLTKNLESDNLDIEELKESLSKIKGIESISYYDDHVNILQNWLKNPPEFVINQCDDGYQNKEELESHLCSLMDMLEIPYTGPGCESFVMVKDKSIVRGLAISINVPVPFEIFIDIQDNYEEKIPKNLDYPVFCKLGNSSGSTGVMNSSVAYNREGVINAIKELKKKYSERPILLQEYLPGREISVGMVGNPELEDFEIFHPVEVDYSNLDPKYQKVQLEEFKCNGESEFWCQVKEVKAKLSQVELINIKEWTKKMFVRCKCKDFARIDFRADKHGQFKVIDVNPNCWLGGKYKMMAEWQGYSWSQILYKIVLTSQKRYLFKKKKYY